MGSMRSMALIPSRTRRRPSVRGWGMTGIGPFFSSRALGNRFEAAFQSPARVAVFSVFLKFFFCLLAYARRCFIPSQAKSRRSVRCVGPRLNADCRKVQHTRRSRPRSLSPHVRRSQDLRTHHPLLNSRHCHFTPCPSLSANRLPASSIPIPPRWHCGCPRRTFQHLRPFSPFSRSGPRQDEPHN